MDKKDRPVFKGKTYILKYPFEYAGEYIERLELRRPRAKDIKHLKSKSDGTFDLSDMLTLVGNCADQPSSLIDMLDATDAMGAIGEVSDFLAGGQETGKISSAS
jgi:hypothetical protein